jgi:putative ABC transport system substrate-binding protein
VIGYLDAASTEADASALAAFRKGLNEAGYVEGSKVAIEERWANDRADRPDFQAACCARRLISRWTRLRYKPVSRAK